MQHHPRQHNDVASIFDKHPAMEADISGSPLVAGNKAGLLVD